MMEDRTVAMVQMKPVAVTTIARDRESIAAMTTSVSRWCLVTLGVTECASVRTALTSGRVPAPGAGGGSGSAPLVSVSPTCIGVTECHSVPTSAMKWAVTAALANSVRQGVKHDNDE